MTSSFFGDQTIRASLLELTLEQLHALRATIDQSGDSVPGLLAWLAHAASWKIDRRAGREYPLQSPTKAIDPSEVSDSLLALAALSTTFRELGSTPAVERFFEATASAIPARGQSLHS